MIKRRSFPKIFFGWWTVVATGIVGFICSGYTFYGFSALLKPLSAELGFSRAVTSVAASITRAEGGFEAPLVGWITDKFGPRWIVIFGVFFLGMGLILMNFVGSLWAFYIVWGVVIGTSHNFAASIALDKAITNWFVKKRGLALSTRWIFNGLAGVLMLPTIAWLISAQGWRMTCIIGGLAIWLVGLPLVWFFLKQHRPEYYGLLPDGAGGDEKTNDVSQMIEKGVKYAAEAQEVEFTLRQAMRVRAFWLLIVANAAHGIPQSTVLIHCVPLLTDIGVDPVRAAVTIGMLSAISLPTRLLGGVIADRVNKNYMRFLMGGAYLLQAVGFALFMLNQTIAMAYVFFILYYFGFGVLMPLNPVMRGRYFGRKAFGSIQGFSQAILTPFGVIAPVYAGWVYDTTGSYTAAFSLFTALLAFAVVTIFFAFPPKPPAQVTDIRKIL
ncbi:MFS transporter [Chloroflexota bacterium]